MLYAYTTFNLGDDLFIKILCERYPETKFLLYAPKEYRILFNKIKNLSVIPSDSLIIRGINFFLRSFKIKGSIRRMVAQKCDAGVYIGGSLFMQGEDWLQGLENVREMRHSNKPFFLLGANFGPFKDEEFYLKYKNEFKEYTDVCFREKYTFELFKDLGNVRMADDIVFQLNVEEFEHAENNIVISVIKPSYRKHLLNYDDIYYKKIRDISIYFIESGYKVTFMSFCDFEGDNEAINEIINLIPSEYLAKIKKYPYKLNIDEAINTIGKADFVLATRFHSMILGWVCNKPVFPIVYSDKMINVMKDVGFKGLYTDFNSIGSLKPEEVFTSMETNIIDVKTNVENAEKHFQKLDIYLK